MKNFGALLVLFATGAIGTTLAAPAFTECPAVGLDAGCAFLITINANGTTAVTQDSAQGPYDGADDTLVGVLNNSATALASLPLTGNDTSFGGIFGFEGDGPCTQSLAPATCPGSGGFDPTGYGGPGVTYSGIMADATGNLNIGVVNFSPGVAANLGTAWFALESPIASAGSIIPGTPNSTPEPATYGLMAASGLLLLGLSKLRKRADNRS